MPPPIGPRAMGPAHCRLRPFLRHDLHQQFAELAKTYGPHHAPPPRRQNLRRHHLSRYRGRDFPRPGCHLRQSRPPASAIALTYGGQDMVWSHNGPLWRLLRKLIVREVMSPTCLDAFTSIRSLMERAGAPVHLAKETFITALNSTTAMLWGGTLEGEERARIGSEFWQATEDTMELLGAANVSEFLPWLARFDLQGVLRESEKRREWLDRILDDVVRQKLKKDSEAVVKKQSSTEQREDYLLSVNEFV